MISPRVHVFMFPHQRKLPVEEYSDTRADLLWNLTGEESRCMSFPMLT